MLRKWNLSLTAITMCKVICALFGGFLIVGLAVTLLLYRFEQPLPYALGLLLGAALSLAKVVLMERSIARTVDNYEGKMAQSYGALMAMLRWLLTLAVLALVFFLRNVFGPFGAVIGILFPQIAAYITARILRGHTTV